MVDTIPEVFCSSYVFATDDSNYINGGWEE